jgi:hypothetical protein
LEDELLDRIRADIEARLKELRAEEQELVRVLKALGRKNGEPAAAAPRSRRSKSATAKSGRKTMTAVKATKSRSTKATPTRSKAGSTPGSTKGRILEALGDGSPRTAGEVATAAGLGRGSVSTTLSKLAKSGEVVKADRGYRLPN